MICNQNLFLYSIYLSNLLFPQLLLKLLYSNLLCFLFHVPLLKKILQFPEIFQIFVKIGRIWPKSRLGVQKSRNTYDFSPNQGVVIQIYGENSIGMLKNYHSKIVKIKIYEEIRTKTRIYAVNNILVL